MKRTLLHLVAAFAFALFFAAVATEGARADADDPKKAETRLALVIGNGAYLCGQLANPVSDARVISKALRSIGFEVEALEDADLKTMEEGIMAFGRKLRSGGVGLFYYAGHGIQVGGRNYLVPVDAKIESESDVRFEAVDAGRVLGKMEDAGNRLNLMILDACRDNPFGRSFRSQAVGLAQMEAPTGTFIAYATGAGRKAADASSFTPCLAEYITIPGLNMFDILIKVRKKVMAETGGLQMPWVSDASTGYFYPAGEPKKAVAAALPAAPQAREPQSVGEMRLGDTGWASPKAMYADTAGKVWLRKEHKLFQESSPQASLFVIRSVSGLTVDVSKCTFKWERREDAGQGLPVAEILNDPALEARQQKPAAPTTVLSMKSGQKAWVPPAAMYADAKGRLWLRQDQSVASERTGAHVMRIERTADGFIVNIAGVSHKWKRSGAAAEADPAVVDLVR